jgi:hypothetical protein
LVCGEYVWTGLTSPGALGGKHVCLCIRGDAHGLPHRAEGAADLAKDCRLRSARPSDPEDDGAYSECLFLGAYPTTPIPAHSGTACFDAAVDINNVTKQAYTGTPSICTPSRSMTHTATLRVPSDEYAYCRGDSLRCTTGIGVIAGACVGDNNSLWCSSFQDYIPCISIVEMA